MPSDCQILGGGHRYIHPIETKSGGGAIAPLPPPPGSRAPAYTHAQEKLKGVRPTMLPLPLQNSFPCLWHPPRKFLFFSSFLSAFPSFRISLCCLWLPFFNFLFLLLISGKYNLSLRADLDKIMCVRIINALGLYIKIYTIY